MVEAGTVPRTPRPPLGSAQRPGLEVLLVLGVSLGQSAAYAIVDLANALTQPKPLSQQTAPLNQALDSRALFDLAYQLLGIASSLVPVLLALYLLAGGMRSGGRAIGLDGRRPGFDLGVGALLFAGIGVPGIGLYLAAVALGVNLQVSASGIDGAWYAVPVLLLSALRSALQEEVIMIGFLFGKLRDAGWRPIAILVGSALIRGSYHLYQGFGGFVGNVVMGLVFGLLYRRFGRVGPLVVAHFLLDAVSFLGYGVAKALFPALHW